MPKEFPKTPNTKNNLNTLSKETVIMANQQEQNTADLLVKSLEEEQVEYIFGIPGEENLPVMNAIEKSNIKFITVRHEQGAAFMADVYGRLTGKAGVCLATLGPGATNLITGVADADSDGAPLVAISGQVGTDKMHITAHQLLDLRAMFEPILPTPTNPTETFFIGRNLKGIQPSRNLWFPGPGRSRFFASTRVTFHGRNQRMQRRAATAEKMENLLLKP